MYIAIDIYIYISISLSLYIYIYVYIYIYMYRERDIDVYMCVYKRFHVRQSHAARRLVLHSVRRLVLRRCIDNMHAIPYYDTLYYNKLYRITIYYAMI